MGSRSTHSHSHSHAPGQAHSHRHDTNEQRIGLAALLTGLFMGAEVVGGIVSGSLALLADAGHMLTDFASLSLAWFGFRLARRPADWMRTYGFDRFQVLIAFVNGLALFVMVGALVDVAERIQFMRQPWHVSLRRAAGLPRRRPAESPPGRVPQPDEAR